MPLDRLLPAALDHMWALAERVLDGVGDGALGEWRERVCVAVHLKRRLRPEEWGDRPWGMDYRGTPAGDVMLAECRTWLPPGYTE